MRYQRNELGNDRDNFTAGRRSALHTAFRSLRTLHSRANVQLTDPESEPADRAPRPGHRLLDGMELRMIRIVGPVKEAARRIGKISAGVAAGQAATVSRNGVSGNPGTTETKFGHAALITSCRIGCRAPTDSHNSAPPSRFPRTNFTKRFEREAGAVAALNQPNIRHLYERPCCELRS